MKLSTLSLLFKPMLWHHLNCLGSKNILKGMWDGPIFCRSFKGQHDWGQQAPTALRGNLREVQSVTNSPIQGVLSEVPETQNLSEPLRPVARTPVLVTRPQYPPYRETGVAIPLSRCVSCGVADYRCYTSTSFLRNGPSQSKDRPNKGGIAEKILKPIEL